MKKNELIANGQYIVQLEQENKKLKKELREKKAFINTLRGKLLSNSSVIQRLKKKLGIVE